MGNVAYLKGARLKDKHFLGYTHNKSEALYEGH
jgi:hypothetical protein